MVAAGAYDGRFRHLFHSRLLHELERTRVSVGIGVSLVGFRPLSLRKHPTAGVAFAVAGFVVRLVGLAIISFGLFLFAAQVASRIR